ncbi:hypothetical protein BDN71DRAFT_1436884 [Pleurotus eryngii]|uniref:Zn(2)-C6 fungal-type domain-containing protein n=1 Tax=Pleurotus eryngii TaxID=5323 RepID=A0A9P6D948_PLEER|nr:hypothetical protein BDN71DRAFT_1436884 [Pleurotus eryngii]
MKKREAVTAYEAEATYFVDMGAVMPEFDDDHREDVEIALADMERQQAWLIKAEDLLIARDLQGSVEDEVKEGLATATDQLLEAREHVKEWEAQDACQVLEQQRAEAAREQRKVQVVSSGRRWPLQRQKDMAQPSTIGTTSVTAAEEHGVGETSAPAKETAAAISVRARRTEGGRSGKRRATESDEDEPETSIPRQKRLRQEAGNAAAEDGEEAAEKDEESEAEEITPPNDVSVYGPYDASAPSGHPGSTAWGCAAGATKKKVCPHPVVQFTQERRCLHCKSAGTPCVGTGCRVCRVCKKRKIECSHAKHRKRPDKVEKVRASRASGSRTSAVKPKTPTKARGQPADEGETSGTVQASTSAATIPAIHPVVYEYKELNALQELLAKADARAEVLMKALEEVNAERTATIQTLGATILRLDEQRAREVEREWAEMRRANKGDEEGEEPEQED